MADGLLGGIADAMASMAVAVCVIVAAPVAAADPLPPMPPDQNQLPNLPRESDLYKFLPVADPRTDPWYSQPADLDAMANGQIVRTRDVGTYLTGIPMPLTTRQILFRTTDLHDNPTVTATTVLIPPVPWIGSPRPILSYQEAIDSSSGICNPSFTLRAGIFKEIALLTPFLIQGFAVVVTDFDGVDASQMLTFGEGRMALDGIRAAKNDPGLGLAESAVGLYGYSGGGSGTSRAAEMHRSYAPELNIVGSAQGGVPGDMVQIARRNVTHDAGIANFTGPGNFTLWLVLANLTKTYPDVFDPQRLFTTEGQELLNNIQGRCIWTSAASGAYRPVNSYLKPGIALEDPEIQRVLVEQSLGQPQNLPGMPVFMWHGIWDELLPFPESIQSTVDKYWDGGVDLRYYTMPIPEHVAADIAGLPAAVAWITAVLRGLPPGPRFRMGI
ncbi:lipase family protein [Nocardia sp. KC 131]|uniref:lipase family protein n=1 Tax=Nocardia arseniciresistens TaxID=3392119 RepID=UPI00398EFCAB